MCCVSKTFLNMQRVKEWGNTWVNNDQNTWKECVMRKQDRVHVPDAHEVCDEYKLNNSQMFRHASFILRTMERVKKSNAILQIICFVITYIS